MILRSLLGGCLGRRGKDDREILGISTTPTKESQIPSKFPEIIIKSQEAFASSQSSTTTVTTKRFNKALCVVSKSTYQIVNDIPYPTLESPKEIIIRTRAVGLNPIDWKSVDYNFCIPSYPWINGRELAGTVVQVGTDVEDFQVGDSVWASTYYRDRRAGTFQEYVVCPQHTVLPLPYNISPELGACLGVPALTAAMTLWKWLGVPMPSEDALDSPVTRRYILVWGGSTVTGQFAIQLALLSGLEVVAVTSAKTKQRVQSLGARHVITRDGKSNAAILADVRVIVDDELTLAIDLVGSETATYCLSALSQSKPAILAPLAFLQDGEPVPANVALANVEMKRFVVQEGNKVYAETLNRLVERGQLIFPELELLSGGLEQIESGLSRLKMGDMGGKKIIVTI